MQNDIELILKQPEGKLPFLGLLYSSSFTGERDNQPLVNNYKSYIYKIEIEPLKANKINIRLYEPKLDLKGSYKEVTFNPDKLKKFLAFNFNAKFFNFGHITVRNNKHEVLRTSVNGASWVLKIDEIKIKEAF